MNTSKNPTKPATTAGLSGIAQRIRHAARVVGIVAVTAGSIVLPASQAAAQTVPTTTTTVAVEQQLFAGSLWATLAMENTAGFTTPGFDGNIFSLSGPFAKNKGAVIRFHNFQATTLSAIQSAAIEVRLLQTGWVDDQVALEYSVDGWRSARALTTFDKANRLPGALTTLRFEGLQTAIATPELAKLVEVRLRNVSPTGKVDVVSFKLDQVALIVKGS